MTAHAQDQYTEPDWVVIAQAEGILSARHHLGIADAIVWLRSEALAFGVPVEQLAEDLVRSAGPADRVPLQPVSPGSVQLDLAEEVALHEEMRARRPEPLELDEATAAALRGLLA
jgi:hypothetical protein